MDGDLFPINFTVVLQISPLIVWLFLRITKISLQQKIPCLEMRTFWWLNKKTKKGLEIKGFFPCRSLGNNRIIMRDKSIGGGPPELRLEISKRLQVKFSFNAFYTSNGCL